MPQFEAKVLLLGEGNVGKTSLVAALRGEPFIRNRSTTHGIEIDEITLPHPRRAINVVLRTWDFGGQEVYRITHQFFFGRRALYLVVWNAREGQEQNEVEGWLRRIRLRVGADAATVIVATHVAERNPELNYPSLRREFPQMLLDQRGVDSETGDGIEDLKSIIAREAARLPQMGQVVSERWIAARDEILALGLVEPQITFDEFSSTCGRHNLSENEIAAFASLLHDLGQIVYYGDDEGLRDVVVLNPEWLTKAIGYVLEDKQTRESHGVLSHKRLKDIWINGPGGKSYSAKYHPYFLRLMEKFDVSYRLDGGDSSLVAQLVPHERPEIPWDDQPLPESVRSLRLNCRLSEPAPGLIAWLTVRNHRSSTDRHWRQGVFLRHAIPAYASEALIELRSDKELSVEVRAPSPDLFFNVIRDGVEDLLIRRWPGLDYQLVVPCPGSLNDQPCPGRFALEGLLRLRERGKEHHDCLECDQEHSVQKLLTGFAATPLAPELERLQEQLKDVAEGLESVERYNADSAASLRRILRATSQEVVDCPRLFTLVPDRPTPMQRVSFWRNTYRLTLWCEHTAEWHSWPEATYQFQRPKEWLIKVGPYVSLLARTLRLVIPIATSITNMSLSKGDQEKMQQELELMRTLSEKLPENLQIRENVSIDPTRDLNPAEGAGLRGFRYVLFQIDKTQQFGGLKRVQAPSGEFLWVCPRHYSVYDPGLPVLPF
ncbi:COR domain-containing protein [Dactylosporangium sp. CA-233914]|uniref:COR domain-containing protein n=1 Tax=Dactylosporangium sp. CA-233914 TaxID=3239934 RepID=UPI003D94E3EE